jgi:chromosome segregation ATPase
MGGLDLEDDGAALELDTDRLEPPEPEPAETSGRAFAPDIPDLGGEGEVLEFSAEDLEALARYGPPPTGPVATVQYALTTRRRSAELRAEASRICAGMEQAKVELVDVLAQLGERARVARYKGRGTAPLLAAVDAAVQDASSAQEAVGAELRRHEARLQEIDQQMDGLRSQMAAPEAQEAQLAGKLGQYQESRRQLEMRTKRIDIELRNAQQLMARHQAAAGDPAKQAEAAQLAPQAAAMQANLPALQAERSQLTTQNGQLNAPIQELTGHVQAVRQQLEGFKTQRVALLRQRQDEEELHQNNTRSASSHSQQAEDAMKDKLCTVGRVVRGDRNAPDWAQELFPMVDKRAESYGKLHHEHEKHQQAAMAYDQEAAKKGLITLAGGAGLALLALFLLIALASALS